jgi:hypothetical protein
MAFETKRFATALVAAGRLAVYGLVMLTILGAARPSAAAPPQNVTVTAQVGPEGATIQAPKAGFSLTFPRGALTRPTVVRLRVAHEQFEELSRPGYVLSPHGIELTLDLNAVAADAVLILRLDFPGDYDPLATTMGIANIRGFTLAVPSRRSRGTQLVGSVDQPSLRALSRHGRLRGHTRLRIFTANAEPVAPPILSTSLSQFVYDPSTGTGSFYHPLADLTNKRVALCVHGIIATLDDLVSLAVYLATYTRPGDSQPYYDVIIGFQYTSNAPLAQIGGAMADLVGKHASGVAALDVYAHSMGTIVSRYAIEIGGTAPRLGPLPGGGHYVSLGGPQVGVPFGNISALQTLLLLFGFSAKPCILDLLTDGQGGPPETPFLSALNPGTDGPDRTTAAYYSLSANDYAAEDPPLGDIVNYLYTRSVPPDGVTNDGLVAVYSAQSPVLGLQSASWQPGLTFDVSHHALVISATVFEELGKLIASW